MMVYAETNNLNRGCVFNSHKRLFCTKLFLFVDQKMSALMVGANSVYFYFCFKLKTKK